MNLSGSQIFVAGLSVVILITIANLYMDTSSSEVSYVKSDLDNQKYLVRNLPDQKQAADRLATIKSKIVELIQYLKKEASNDGRTKKIEERFRPDQLSESSDDSKYTSYSINKGEKIVFCLRQRDATNDLVDMNTMMFVTIHELAHLATDSVGHKTDFWNNMKWLLRHAVQIGIYNYVPYGSRPQSYCGTMITDTPLSESELHELMAGKM